MKKEMLIEVKNQFLEEELPLYIELVECLGKQLGRDASLTEFLLIGDIVKLEILSNRCLKDTAKCGSTILDLEVMIDGNHNAKGEPDHKILYSLEQCVIGNREAILSLDRRYLELIEKKYMLIRTFEKIKDKVK